MMQVTRWAHFLCKLDLARMILGQMKWFWGLSDLFLLLAHHLEQRGVYQGIKPLKKPPPATVSTLHSWKSKLGIKGQSDGPCPFMVRARRKILEPVRKFVLQLCFLILTRRNGLVQTGTKLADQHLDRNGSANASWSKVYCSVVVV